MIPPMPFVGAVVVICPEPLLLIEEFIAPDIVE